MFAALMLAAATSAATPDITWTLMPNGTIERKFGQRINGKLIDRGSDTCTRA